MSLFQLREWWRHQQATEEFGGSGSLCLAQIQEGRSSQQQIITGSFSGQLRVFNPSGPEFSPAHVLLEHQLNEPILQVAWGRFSSSCVACLAVLHPRRLALYHIAPPDMAGGELPFVDVLPLASQLIPHTAANMVHGAFGGRAAALDSILVQALDGQVYLFEDGQQVHVTFLEDFLLPGPLLYTPETDQIITCTSSFQLQGYTYSSIVQASRVKAEAADSAWGQAAEHGKAPRPVWTCCIGEMALDLQLAPSDGKARADIVVVGEHTILICTQDGDVVSQRRLEYHPSAAVSYRCACWPPVCEFARHNFVAGE